MHLSGTVKGGGVIPGMLQSRENRKYGEIAALPLVARNDGDEWSLRRSEAIEAI